MVEKATSLRRHRIITFQNISYPINGTDSHTIGIDVAITQLVLHSRKIFFDPVYRTTRRSTSTSTLRRGFQTTPSARGSPAASALRSPTTRRAKPSRLTCERRPRRPLPTDHYLAIDYLRCRFNTSSLTLYLIY